MNRPLWTEARDSAKSVDKKFVESQEAQAVREKISIYLDAYDLAQVKCSGKLALCTLGRREIMTLRRIGMAVHAPAFEGRTVVPVVQAECGAFLNNVNEQDGNAAADAQKDMISDETIFASEEEKKLQNDSQKERIMILDGQDVAVLHFMGERLMCLLGREIKVYDITQELRPHLRQPGSL